MRSNRCLELARSGWWSAHKVNKTLFPGSWLAATLAGGPPPFKARVTTRLATVGSTSSSATPHLRFALCACQPPNGFMSATARHAGSDDTILQELKLWMPRPLRRRMPNLPCFQQRQRRRPTTTDFPTPVAREDLLIDRRAQHLRWPANPSTPLCDSQLTSSSV